MLLKNKVALGVIASLLLPVSVSAQVRVKGYVNKNGTYVAPHYRSKPNSTTLDNYSTRGNYNPYTGQVGSKDPYANPYGSTFGSRRSSSPSSSTYGSTSSDNDDSGYDPE